MQPSQMFGVREFARRADDAAAHRCSVYLHVSVPWVVQFYLLSKGRHLSSASRGRSRMPILRKGDLSVDYLDDGAGPVVVLVHSSVSGNKQ